jgi:hypothetical protein
LSTAAATSSPGGYSGDRPEQGDGSRPATVTIAELDDALPRTLHDAANQVNSLSEHSDIPVWIAFRIVSQAVARIGRIRHNVCMTEPRHLSA